jgi:hypothetical protein
VNRIKRNADSHTTKLKARLMARGFQQRKGIDYSETFASTSQSKSWHIILAHTTYHGWIAYSMDVVIAYLQAKIDVQIFIRQFYLLNEFFAQHPELAQKHSYDKLYIIEIAKPLYGLKQSGQ